MRYRQTVEIQIRFRRMCSLITLEYMLHVRSLSSIILIRKCHNHTITAFYLTANPYLYIFLDVWLLYESFSTYAYEQRCQWSVCVDAQACVFLNFLHASNTQNSHARLKYDLRHALIMEKTHSFDFKAAYSVTMNTFLVKSFVKVELSYVFTIKMFSTAENCMEK